MADRTVTDAAGRAWTCTAASVGTEKTGGAQGRDLVLTCVTPSVAEALRLTVGWQWKAMSANGLARLISQASPAPRA